MPERLLGRTETVWAEDCDVGLNGPEFCRVRMDERTSKTYSLSSSPLLLEETSSKHEDWVASADDRRWGNVGSTVTTLDDPFSTQVITETFDWDYSVTGDGWFNKLESKTVTTGAIEYKTAAPVELPSSDNVASSVITAYEYYTSQSDHRYRLVKKEELQKGQADQELTTLSDYDLYGNVSDVTVTTASGDSRQMLISNTSGASDPGYFMRRQRNAELQATDFTVNPRNGGAILTTDPNGLSTGAVYDGFGTVVRSTSSGVPPTYLERKLCSEVPCPDLPGVKPVLRVKTTQYRGPTTMAYVDARGREVATAVEAMKSVSGVSEYALKVVVHDGRGRVVEEWDPVLGDPTTQAGWNQVAPAGKVVRSGFDARGRSTVITQYRPDFDDPYDVLATTMAYDGLTTTETRPDTTTFARTVDGRGREVQTTDARGHDVAMAYAPTGGLGLVVDHEGHGKWLVYDALGRRVKTFEPNSGEYTLRYDGFGDLTEEFTPNGDWFFYEYDRLGRKTSEAIAHVSPSGPGPLVPQANWVYDETFIGALTYEQGGTNGPSSYCRAFEYDSRGRVVQDVVHHDAGVLVTQKAYDAYVGRLKAVAFPDAVGTTVGLMYGPSGHFLGEFDPGTGDVYREITSRDARGQITSEIFGNGLVGEYDLSPSTSSTKQLVVRNPSTGDVFQHLEYEYDDPRTLLTKRHNLVHQVEERFGYDDLQRLEYAERTWVPFPLRPGGTERVDYEYNNVGNLTFKSDYAQIVEYGDVDRDGPSRAGPHAIRSYTDTNGVVIDDFEYDANGNLLVGDGRETAYDAYNKPTRIETNWSGSIADFRYGPNRELYRRSEGSEVTWMVGEYYERVDDGSGTVRHRLRIGDRVTMLVEAGTSETLYRHPDRLGSAALTTKSNGTVFERRGHGPFGNPRDGDWHDVGVLNSSVDEQGFIGHDHIDSARVVHMGGRVYDYRLGRFMSVDPFAEVADLQSHNSYSYVRNNSLNRVDPTGYIDVEDTPKEVEPDPDTIVIYDDGTARDTNGEVVFKLSGMDMARLNNQLTTSFGAKQNGLLLLTDIPDWPLPGGSRGGDGNANRGGQGSAGTSAKNGIEDTTMSMTTAELGGLTVAKAAEILIEKGIFKRRALRDLKDRTKVALARKGAGPTAPRKKFDSWEKAVDFVNTHEGWFHAGGLTVTNGKSKTMYIFMGATKSVETIHWKRGRKVLMTPRQSMLHTVHHEFLHWDGQPSHGADPLGRNFVRWNIRVRNELDSWLDDDF